MSKLLSAPVFFSLFGAMFLAMGIRRLLRVHGEQNKGEALIWGSIGVVLALAFFGIAWWMVSGDAAELDRQWWEIESRRRGP
jgi:hypothetical protein